MCVKVFLPSPACSAGDDIKLTGRHGDTWTLAAEVWEFLGRKHLQHTVLLLLKPQSRCSALKAPYVLSLHPALLKLSFTDRRTNRTTVSQSCSCSTSGFINWEASLIIVIREKHEISILCNISHPLSSDASFSFSVRSSFYFCDLCCSFSSLTIYFCVSTIFLLLFLSFSSVRSIKICYVSVSLCFSLSLSLGWTFTSSLLSSLLMATWAFISLFTALSPHQNSPK